MKKVKVKIEKNEFIFIDGNSGKRLTPEEYQKKYGKPMPKKYR